MTENTNKSSHVKNSILKKILISFFILSFISVVFALLGSVWLYFHFSRDLPKISRLEDYRPYQVTEVFSDSGEKIAEFYKEKRYVIPLSEMPDYLVTAFVSAEDSRFYEHGGIDLMSILRATIKNIHAGGIVQGGSTITQQVAKSFFLSPEKKYARKMKEAILAYRIDKHFSKDEVLYLYLNQIYLGYGTYGVEAAARTYFGKHAKDLTLSEASILAGLPQAPSRYSPIKHLAMAKKRQLYVLTQMVKNGYISQEESDKAYKKSVYLARRINFFQAKTPYYSEYIRQYIKNKYGDEGLYKRGLKIYSAVSIALQHDAQKSLNSGLENIDKREGYRGPLRHLSKDEIQPFFEKQKKESDSISLNKDDVVKAIVTRIDNKEKFVEVRFFGKTGILKLKNMSWARKPDTKKYYLYHKIKTPGEALRVHDLILVKISGEDKESGLFDVSLEQTPEVSGAILSIKSETGEVKAMVGGRKFASSQFNRAVQSRRQPGSAFKPIIYSAALDKGYTPASVVMDNAFVFHDKKQDFTWKPQNYHEKFYGPTRLRKALALSRNLVTIKLLKDIGIPYVISYAKKMGIESPMSPNLSLALGSSGLSLLELTKAYSVFENNGKMVKPIFIRKIVDFTGKIIEETKPESYQVIPEETAYLMTSMLESVVKKGTGWRARALKRPVAGKTGTTNNLFDAWFVGYTANYITGTWVGFDEAKSLGKKETGSQAACPIWLDFMKKAHSNLPVKDFNIPQNIIFQKIDANTGLLPGPDTKQTLFECFAKGTEPVKHSPSKKKVKDDTDFLKYGM